MNTKSSLRQYYRNLRRCISAQEKTQASQAVAEAFLSYLQLQKKNFFKIAVYLAHDGELDLQPLINKLWQLNYLVYLPVLDAEAMHFVLYDVNSVMQKNRYGIEEPMGEFINRDELEFVLMPLVAFDKTGARLGMGKGYYDKTFSNSCLCELIGVAYSCQCAKKLSVDVWDVPLDGILTEKEFIFFDKNHE